MDLKALVEYVAKTLVNNPDAVTVNEVQKRSLTILELHVAPEDMGRVIGKEGRVANALRVVLRSAVAESGKRISLDIV
ncbi:MAG: KH domain-containing protein [Anaerolinea sp.]|nr:KH domain-containing protein [Anaerolinea sp.]MCC6973116.1 KH domain-containing protein [Anaerolineae bacterium]CAG0979500.1 hypothetical protein ANRL4_01784 [Anaerolineae bacterium]